MKKSVSFLLAFIITLLLVPCSYAETAEPAVIKQGSCGKNVTYVLYDNGHLEISGSGDMYNWNPYASNPKYAPWDEVMYITSVKINSGVTSVGNGSFYKQSKLEKAELPETVDTIGRYAFYCCKNLKIINLPDALTLIYSYSFYECRNLKLSSLPDNIASVNSYAFYLCDFSEMTELPSALTYIGEGGFNSTKIRTLNIPPSLKTIKDYAFCGTYLKSVIVPNTVEEFGKGVFNGCKLREVTLPYVGGSQGQRTLRYIFDDDVPKTLRKVVLTDETEVYRYAFNNCSELEEISLPATLTSIRNDHTFYGCKKLKKVHYAGTADQWNKISGHDVFNSNVLISFVPDTGNKCGTNLTWKLHDSGELVISGRGAMTAYKSELQVPWFADRDKIKKVTLSNDVTTIGSCAFAGCRNLTEINMNGYITEIGHEAFENCFNLKTAPLNQEFVDIGDSAFYQCINLESKFEPQICGIGNYAFYRCDKLSEVTIPEYSQNLGDFAFSECTGLKNVTIENECNFPIQTSAFQSCVNLTSVKIGEGVTQIQDEAFSDCTALQSVSTPDSLTLVGHSAFKNCTSLKLIQIPKNTLVIDYFAFYNCTSLENADIENGVIKIGRDAFYSCTSLKKITIPGTVTDLGEEVFSACTALESAVYSEGLESTGVDTFDGCTELKKITIPLSMKEIIPGSFDSCEKITDIYYAGTLADWNKIKITSGGSANSKERIANASKHFMMSERGTVSYGICSDSITWLLYDDGELLIEGDGEMPDYTRQADNTSPWYDKRSQISSITVGDGITYIGTYAFCMCNAVTYVKIPKSVIKIGSAAFLGCTKLMDIYYTGTDSEWKAIVIEDPNTPLKQKTMHYGEETDKTGTYGDNLNWTLENNGTLTISGEGAMKASLRKPWESYSDTIKSLVITGGVTSICNFAFQECINLTDVILGDGITDIGEYAFLDCSSLKSIVLPDSVTVISSGLFDGCTALEDVKLGKNVSIEEFAFFACTSLISIYLPKDISTISENAFGGCYNLEDVYFGGTQSEWDSKTIKDYYIIVARKYYSCTDYPLKAKIRKSENYDSFTVGTSDIPNGSTVMLALYKNGKLTDTKSDICTGSDISFTSDKSYDQVKVMALNSLQTLTPVCGAFSCKSAEVKLKTTVTPDDDSALNHFTVDTSEIPKGACVVLALYRNGRLIDVLNKPCNNYVLFFSSEKAYDETKVMAVDSLDTLTPLCEPYKI